MTAVDLAGIENKHDELVRKGIKGGVWLSDTTTDEITSTNLFDATSGGLVVLPTGYKDGGRISSDGVSLPKKITSTDLAGWGTIDPIRSDITADTKTVKFDFVETNAQTIAMYTGVDLASIVPDGTNGTFEIPEPTEPNDKYFRMLVLAVDGSPGDEFVIGRFLPRCKVTDYDAQTFSNGKDPIIYGGTWTAYKDSALGYAQKQLYGGEQILGLLDTMGFNRVVTCTVAATTALVATGGSKFEEDDEGAVVSGVGLVGGQTILEVIDSTHATLSAAGTVAGTGVAVTIHAQS